MKLVIVESPAKAKTINKYLGSDFDVVASFGHVRDLPSKNGSVLPEENFKMKYETIAKSQKYVQTICDKAKKAEAIYLSTDPDREGEAIAWHVVELLKSKKALGHTPALHRITFNEITKKAVLDAVAHPRNLDEHLIDAQQARRALDYLVGFTLSPVLWKKLPGCKSAGRVQSVALRLISDREEEIENFVSQEYWNIHFDFANKDNKQFSARLTEFNGEKLEKFSITNAAQAREITDKLLKEEGYHVVSVQHKEQRRTPPAPFTTSSLQQEAARKLYFSAKKTMQLAQKLYEGIEVNGETIGLITYMRTDGVYLAEEAITSIRKVIEEKYGSKYLPKSPRAYKSKARNAQEAHEAIRPTNIALSPDQLSNILEKDLFNLYELIWKRTISCQMEQALIGQVVVDITSKAAICNARATGNTLLFDGFYRLYQEGIDDPNDNDEDGKMLPALAEGEMLNLLTIEPSEHHTEPPPRYSEASLVKKLEEYGIGRPSTYATIISVLQERDYVRLDKKRFIPESRGRLVTSFLVHYFAKYVEYDFTAQLEDQLDEIAEGKRAMLDVLSQFWQGFSANINEVGQYKITEVIEELEKALEHHLFADENAKICPQCKKGQLKLKLGKFGGFLSCSSYPECTYSQPIDSGNSSDSEEKTIITESPDKLLGTDENNIDIWLKKGPYGWYVQLGENNPKAKPKRVGLPANVSPEALSLGYALNLLSLPKIIGNHPETAQEISVNIGKFGPYVKHGGMFASIPKNENMFALTVDRAVILLAAALEAKKSKQADSKS